MKPTKKEEKKVNKGSSLFKNKRLDSLEELVIMMGKKIEGLEERLNNVERINNRLRERIGVWCYYLENI